ncbi:MAG: hypothetical protein AVDCRST_MAG78-2349 [uncultured Rubrobacteraceae bacterium]|uniref:Uncharacterized protein n=1 Tax=uncultured Rubrobacteraceae bacterium TaxID=349277 RepID=A0A6J4QHN9_9ACTN|nr:MAG: hypothetical protein AVDCRST_MAG78-2349 [uncultured Rubrobacteraceae bacterium]
MTKHNSPIRPVEEEVPRKRTRSQRRIREILAVCGALVAVVVPVVLVNTYGGQSSAAEEEPESQLSATNLFDLEPGLAIVEMTHQGEGDFVVDLLPAEQEENAARPERIEFFGDQNDVSGTGSTFALAKEAGSVDISRAVGIQTAGKHVFDVKASGPWTIQVDQPRPSGAPEPTRFSGDDATATPLFQLSSGPKEISVTNPGGEKLEISLLDGEGNEVDRVLEDETDGAETQPAASSSTVDIREAGIYLFDVRAESLWTVEISDAG